MVQPDEEILKIDLGSNKFCELIVGKLNAVLPHKVIEVGKISNQIERESLGAQLKKSVTLAANSNLFERKSTMPNLPARALEGRISEERKSEEREHLRRHSIETVPDEDLKVEIEESSDSDSEENPNIGNESLSETAKSFIYLKNEISEKKVFLEIRDGVYMYGIGQEGSVGFLQFRNLRKLRTIVKGFVELKKYELSVFGALMFGLVITVLKLSHMLFLSIFLTLLLGSLFSLVSQRQTGALYLKKEIMMDKVKLTRSRGPHSRRAQEEDLDDSFCDDVCNQFVRHSKVTAKKLYRLMECLMMNNLMTSNRRKITPFAVKCEVKGQIIKIVNEENENSFYIQHLIKHGKNKLVLLEIEKFRGEIHHMYQIKFDPKLDRVVISAYIKNMDGKSSLDSFEALVRKVLSGCANEKQAKEAVKISYFKYSEFVPETANRGEYSPVQQLQTTFEDYLKAKQVKNERIRLESLAAFEAKQREAEENERLKQEQLPNSVDDQESKPQGDMANDNPGHQGDLQVSEGTEDLRASAVLKDGQFTNEATNSESNGDRGSLTTQVTLGSDQIAGDHLRDGEDKGEVARERSTNSGILNLSGLKIEEKKGPQPRTSFGLTIPAQLKDPWVKNFESKMKLFLDLTNLNGGKMKEMEKKNGVTIYEEQSDPLIRVLSTLVFPYKLEDIIPYLKEPDFRLKYDSVLRSIEVLKRINDNIAVVRAVVKGQFPVSDRDFITYVVLTQPDPNTFISLTYEAADYDYPPNSKAVRADIEVTGSILRRTENNETHFTMFSSTDPKIKGVPQSFIRSKARQSGMAVYDLLTIIKKEKASKK